ncbi:MAG: DUF1499 domain-containing protein [Pseudomonadota bacterium]|nr:DUF1499 domain-containing protein [Pseudomonadota bacterium]
MTPAHLALLLSLAATILLLMAGPGVRAGWWEFSTGFQILKWAAFTGIAGALVALIMVAIPRVRRSGLPSLMFALVLGLAVAYVPWQGLRQARSVPPIHDITTDTETPPEFVAVLPLRADAPNSTSYAGSEVAEAQLEAYPDIRPYIMSAPAPIAFEQALEAAREMGWEIVAADPVAGRIEATDTTFWFGFKDDVVVRVSQEVEGTRIDVRSVSRVGKSDVGANAERIREYLDHLDG